MRLAGALTGLGLLIAGPLEAQTFRAESRINVTPLAGGFAVEDGGGMGARGMWCAASQYARRVLGATGTQRIYVTGPRTSANRRAPVLFSLDPGAATPSRVTIVGRSIGTAGASLSVDHANVFCADFRMVNQ